ncbi:hypothetical protein ACM44_08015 [Chryseobacterium koreense CCUG 49689]|uniref:Uncharacterized protein n=1 Tax=Chryseobacterium koreense CCUG 49689 TaxID=1304281 RepID=A0A0J7IY06_9FLAO|nr:hypothetical protein ACM44_08015 [Chryseobacterium koreense CCUG 49689]
MTFFIKYRKYLHSICGWVTFASEKKNSETQMEKNIFCHRPYMRLCLSCMPSAQIPSLFTLSPFSFMRLAKLQHDFHVFYGLKRL